MKRKRIIALIMSACLLVSTASYAYADETAGIDSSVEAQESGSDEIDSEEEDEDVESAIENTADNKSDLSESEVRESANDTSDPSEADDSLSFEDIPEDVSEEDINGKKLDDVINSAEYTPDHGIPRLNLELSETTIDEINTGSKDTKYAGNILAICDSGDPSQNAVYDNVEIKGRGNYTWKLAKKPYQIKFDKKTSLFGMTASKKYVLLANAADKSLLRNVFGFALSAQMDLWHSDFQFVDLYADGEYLGNYLLTQKTEIGSYSADLKNKDGILVEMDLRPEDEGDLASYSSFSGCHLVLNDSKSDDASVKENAFQSFTNAYSSVEKAANEGDWETVSGLIDVSSFARYYLFQELIANPDAARTSFFMYRDGEQDKIHAGPTWDFDIAIGNSDYAWNDTSKMYLMLDERDVTESYPVTGVQSKLFNDLMQMTEFRDIVSSIWNENGHEFCNNALSVIANQESYVKESSDANAAQWNYAAVGSGAISDFILSRAAYFDLFFSESESMGTDINYAFKIGTYYMSYSSTNSDETLFLSLEKPGREHDFCLTPSEDSRYYTITDSTGELVLEADKDDQTSVRITAGNNGSSDENADGNSQNWLVHKNSDGTFNIVSALTGYVLSVENDTIGEGSKIVLATYNGSAAQKFTINESEMSDVGMVKLTGKNRYATAVMAAKEAFPSGSDSVVLASGQNFPDALSAGSLAGVLNAPILLTAQDELSDAVRSLLQDQWKGTVKNIYIIGGTASISEKVENTLQKCGIESSNIHRYYGENRYATAEDVFRHASTKDKNIDTIAVAIGTAPADALSFSSWSYSKHIPILLADSTGKLDVASKALIARYQIKNVILLGGGVKESCACGKPYVRLSGSNRYETSLKIARYFIGENGSYTGTIFAKGGNNEFPDALVSGPLAGKNNAPVILLSATSESTYQLIKTESLSLQKGCYLIGAMGADNTVINRLKKCGLSYVNHSG